MTAESTNPEPGTEQEPSSMAPALADFYANRKLMWRNVGWIMFGHFGMALAMTIVEPLMNLRLKAIGVSDSAVGLLTSANLWGVSFLVMYFSWKSDHCMSPLGRRTPFVLLSLPFIGAALVCFPLSDQKWLLIALMAVYYFFNDMKASTYPLLSIDCVSKDILARVSGLGAVSIGLAGFLSSRWGSKLADVSQTRLFVLAAAAMVGTTLLALWRIQEPPVKHPATGSFNFLAPIKTATRDKRILVLMLAIGMLNACPMVFKTWIWFYSKTKLGLSISDTGTAFAWGILIQVAVSFPSGWLIDKLGSYVALCIEWSLMLVLVVCALYVKNVHGLTLLVCLYFLFLPLQVAGDTLLWKIMGKADIGSYTSTVAMIRNFSTGTMIAISGYVIKWTGSYVAAFWFGFSVSTIAVIVFFIYRYIMRSDRAPRTAVAAAEQQTAGLLKCDSLA